MPVDAYPLSSIATSAMLYSLYRAYYTLSKYGNKPQLNMQWVKMINLLLHVESDVTILQIRNGGMS